MTAPNTVLACSGGGGESNSSGIRCDAPAGGQEAGSTPSAAALAELEPSQRPAQSAESSGLEVQATPSQRSGAGDDAAVESAESDGSDFQRSFSQGSTESDADVDDDGGIAGLVEENNELYLRARYLEERLRAAEEAERRKLEARRAAGAETEARRQRTRLLWQKAILSVRAQISRAKRSELSLRLVHANAKAKEAASMSVRLEKEISKVKEISNIFEENRARVVWTEQDTARFRGNVAAQKARLEQAHWDKMLEMQQDLQVRGCSSTAPENSKLQASHAGASTQAEAQHGRAARGPRQMEAMVEGGGSSPEQSALRDVTATIETQQGAIDQLVSYTKALEAKLKERRSAQDELTALRQRVRLLEAEDVAPSAPQAS